MMRIMIQNRQFSLRKLPVLVRVTWFESTASGSQRHGLSFFQTFPVPRSSLCFLDLLSGPLCPTVSVYSGPAYGQLCGKNRFPNPPTVVGKRCCYSCVQGSSKVLLMLRTGQWHRSTIGDHLNSVSVPN